MVHDLIIGGGLGRRADLAGVCDFGNPDHVNDCGGGTGRLLVRASGHAATLADGDVIARHREPVGARPGRVLREFARS